MRRNCKFFEFYRLTKTLILVVKKTKKYNYTDFEAIVANITVVPTPLFGGETIYSIGFFLFKQFWPIEILMSSINTYDKNDYYHYRAHHRVRTYFRFFGELSRFNVLCEHVTFGIILITLSVIFVKIEIFSRKILVQKYNYILLYKWNNFFCVLYGQKP